MYSSTTNSIIVTVKPVFLDDQSSPGDGHYVWAYHVRIENEGQTVVQLLNRHWKITDSTGHTHEVRGAGVVGEQPVLTPGESFEYTSGTPLATPSGFMVGSYEMETQSGAGSGKRFEVEIPLFSLDSPHEATQIH